MLRYVGSDPEPVRSTAASRWEPMTDAATTTTPTPGGRQWLG
jgi:hypothetical protein